MKRRDFAKALVFPVAAVVLAGPWARARAQARPTVPATGPADRPAPRRVA